LTTDELINGRRRLVATVNRFAPRCLAILGIGAYRVAFEQKNISLGKQPESIGMTSLWVLPNPSGLNAHYQPPELVRQFRLLRDSVVT
jgi:double-stranded uracil-DNA glycosylase